MGYRLNRLDEPVLIAVSKPMLTDFGIHHRLESSELQLAVWPHISTSRSIHFLSVPVQNINQPAFQVG